MIPAAAINSISASWIFPSSSINRFPGTGGISDSGTAPVSADEADAKPALFVAVSTTRSDNPTSSVVTGYDEPVAPETSEQTSVSHCCHWNPYEIGSVPVHEPPVAVSVPPITATPDTDGGDTLLGATGGATRSGTTPVSTDDTDADPTPFVAVSTTRSDNPMSLAVTEYDKPVAPETSEQTPVSHCCHWKP